MVDAVNTVQTSRARSESQRDGIAARSELLAVGDVLQAIDGQRVADPIAAAFVSGLARNVAARPIGSALTLSHLVDFAERSIGREAFDADASVGCQRVLFHVRPPCSQTFVDYFI